MTIVAVFLVDRAGRRPLFLVGIAGMIVALILLGISFLHHSDVMSWLALFGLMLYFSAFSVSFGPLGWVVVSEVFPSHVRAIGIGAAAVVAWFTHLIVSLTFLSLTSAIGKPATFWLYAGITIASWFFVFFIFPETKQKTLEEMKAIFRTPSNPEEEENLTVN